jgi:hypoxanthine phosphoribosyltransferase
VNNSREIDFSYLKPQKVKLKLIYDTNPNGKWDSGNYPWKIQPEKIQYYDKLIDIHPNWFIEEQWIILPEDLPEKYQ